MTCVPYIVASTSAWKFALICMHGVTFYTDLEGIHVIDQLELNSECSET